jgi:hypothetical protein
MILWLESRTYDKKRLLEGKNQHNHTHKVAPEEFNYSDLHLAQKTSCTKFANKFISSEVDKYNTQLP